MSKKVLVKIRLGKTGDASSAVKANDHSVYQVEDAGKQLEFLNVTRSHNDLLISNKRTGESLLLKDYYEQSDVAVIVQGEGDKSGLWMLDSGANLAGSADLTSVLIPAPESSGAFWGGMDWPLLEVLLPVGVGAGLAFAGNGNDAPVTLSTPSAVLSTDSGANNADGLSNDANLKFSALQEGATRTYSINGGPQTTSYTPPTIDGAYSVVVTDRMADGQTTSTTVKFTLDKTIATPTVALVTDTGVSTTDAVTQDASIVVGGTPAADVTRTYSINGGATSSSYIAPTADGAYTVTVTDTDAAGNTASASTSFTLDKTIATPTVALVTDSGTSSTDGLTNNAALAVSAAAADVTRTYSINGGAASSSYIAPTVDGTYTVTVTDTDAAGNTASGSTTFTLDKTIATPTVALVTDTGVSTTDAETQDASIVVGGTPAADVTRTYSINGGAASSSYVAPTADGKYTVTVTDTDVAGNTASASTTYTLDRSIDKPTLAIDPKTATVADLSTTFPTLVEQLPADIAVRTYTLFNDATQTTTTTTDSFSVPTASGFYELIATYTDLAGNQASSDPLAFYVGNGLGNTATDTNVSSTIIGGSGDDALYGKGGVDLIYGGPGYDDIYVNTDNLNQLLNGKGVVNGGAQTDALHIQDVVPKFSLDSLVNVVKGIEIIQFDQSSPVGGLGVSAAAVQAIADINGIGQSAHFSSTVLDPAKHQMAFGASSGGGASLDVGNAAEWVKVGTALYDNTAVMSVYNHLTLPVQIIL